MLILNRINFILKSSEPSHNFHLMKHTSNQVMEPLWHIFCDVPIWRPVFQLQQHRGSLGIEQPMRDILEAFPKPFERLSWNSFSCECVHKVRPDVAEVLGEGPGMPKAVVHPLVAVADQHRLASVPLLLEETQVAQVDRVLQLELPIGQP